MGISTGPVMVLCENGDIPRDSLVYAVEMSGQIKSDLVLFLLRDDDEDKSDQIMTRVREIATEHGFGDLSIVMVTRGGDRASEFLKFFALNPAPVLMVWGISSSKLDSRKLYRRGHWFAKVAVVCHWPVVFPTRRGAQSWKTGSGRQTFKK